MKQAQFGRNRAIYPCRARNGMRSLVLGNLRDTSATMDVYGLTTGLTFNEAVSSRSQCYDGVFSLGYGW
jgi:hypothetical protein